MAHYMKPMPYSVKMRFTLSEYELFRLWYRSSLSFGTLPFDFPQIDSENGQLVTYQFAEGGAPKYSNPTGKLVEADMKWERVWN